MEQQTRPLLPKPISAYPLSSDIVPVRSSRRRGPISVACDNCRKRKTACGRERPICSPCLSKGVSCSYQLSPKDARAASKEDLKQLRQENEKLKQELNTFRLLVSMNQDRPIMDDEYFDLGQTSEIRGRAKSALERRSLFNLPSAISSARAVLPPIYSELEMFLHVQHPLAYPLVKPHMRPSLYDAYSFVHGLVIWDISNMNVTLERGSKKQSYHHQIKNHENTPPLPISSVGPKLYTIVREGDIDIQRWTNITVPIKHVLGGIKLYLETDHRVWGMFDVKLFLSDLVTGSRNFCSPFLVNSFLAYILLPYMADQDIDSLLHKDFQAQAIREWDEQDNDIVPKHITTLVGLILLSFSLSETFAGELGRKFLQHAVDMAAQLRLFNTTNPLTIEDMITEDDNTKQATAHIAWGVYVAVTFNAIFHLIDSIDDGPLLPLPAPRENDRVYLQIGVSVHSVPTSTNEAFVGMCKLCTQYNAIRPDRSRDGDQIPLVLSRFNKILAIQNDLSQITTSRQGVEPEILIFNIWYHVVIMDLFRPCILEARQRGFYKSSDSPNLPEAIFSASVKQLQDIILEFSMNHLVTPYSSWWHPALLYVANAALCDTSNPTWYLLFLLCYRCYQRLMQHYPVAIGVLKGLLAMALEKGALTLDEARSILAPHQGSPRPSAGFGIFVIDLDKALVFPIEAQVDTLASQIETMDVSNTWT